MADVMSPEKRSALMSRIRGRDTKPELQIRKALWHAGLRFRLNVQSLPGRPDIVLPRWGAVIFVHGCFWHRHEGCPLFRLPSTRTSFWNEKLARNRVRDEQATSSLAAAGWRILTIWECALRASPAEAGRLCVGWVRNYCGDAEIAGKDREVILD
jgi:DNA mismatch endonuclease (patch repair protein)